MGAEDCSTVPESAPGKCFRYDRKQTDNKCKICQVWFYQTGNLFIQGKNWWGGVGEKTCRIGKHFQTVHLRNDYFPEYIHDKAR